ncbi:alpha-1A adrenergic receptor [Misgurnus anguillicaudatus]|uniref:alpha-1A adrenergic receptor n=1 Tax=Misgurnus anguillicaudatus TaxID=75329 RepID=UPI003CCFCF90
MTNVLPAEDNITSDFCPNCSVISSFDIDVSKSLVLGFVLLVFMIFGVMGNILVILSVACHRHLRSMAHYFIANLAVADLLLSSVVLPFSAASEALGHWAFGRTLCNVWTAVDVLCCTASILSLTVISVDRCVAVSFPLQYPSLATGRRALAAVVALWVLSIAISVGPLFGWRDPMPEDESVCRVNEELGYTIFSTACSFYVPLTVILAMYCRVYIVARHKTSSMSKGREANGLTGKHEVMLRIHCRRAQQEENKRSSKAFMCLFKFSREQKAAKTLGIVVGCFVLCWLPFFLVLPISSIFPSHRPSETVFKITFWLGYFNSCLNPVIYPCFSQEFKKAFQNVLHGRCLRRTPRTFVSCRDHTTLHVPKPVSPFGLPVTPPSLPSISVDSNNVSPSPVALTKNLYSANASACSSIQAPETTISPMTKIHQVSIGNIKGEDL